MIWNVNGCFCYQSTWWSLTTICHGPTNSNWILKICTVMRFAERFNTEIWHGVRILRRCKIFRFVIQSVADHRFVNRFIIIQRVKCICLTLNSWWTDVRNGNMTLYETAEYLLIWNNISIDQNWQIKNIYSIICFLRWDRLWLPSIILSVFHIKFPFLLNCFDWRKSFKLKFRTFFFSTNSTRAMILRNLK